MFSELKKIVEKLDGLSKNKPIKIISHFDTDGITAAAIFARAMERWGKKFSLEITKGLDRDFIEGLSEDNVLIFLDLGSGVMNYLAKKNVDVIIFDHHEIVQEIPKNVTMVNPFHERGEILSGAAVAYFFAKEISYQNRDLANLAVIGMVGDLLEKNIGKKFNELLEDSETIVKKGLLVYPSTRPIDRALEYSYNPFIPGVSGFFRGVLELLRDAGINNSGGRYKALYEFDEEEMGKLITAVMLRCSEEQQEKMIGNLFLVKFFNKLEDARELSALINACSRMGHPEMALGFCLGNKYFREVAEEVYIIYKQNLVSALRYASESEKILGSNYVIIHGQDKIKDTIIGTVASIISHSPTYKEGSIVVALAYNEDKVKVSARVVGR